MLVLLISIALLRGSIFGALAGFGAGFLIDTANLGTLGFTSLLLTLAGFWTGRYGETTARDRFHAPYTLGRRDHRALRRRHARAPLLPRRSRRRPGPYLSGLPATVLLNLILTWPVYGLARRLFPPADVLDRVHEVRLLG